MVSISEDREKVCGFGWRGKWEESKTVGECKARIRIGCMNKKYVFNKKGRIR